MREKDIKESFWVSCRDCYFCQFDSDGIDVDGCSKQDYLEELTAEYFSGLPETLKKKFEEATETLQPEEDIVCICPIRIHTSTNPEEFKKEIQLFYEEQENEHQLYKSELRRKLALIAGELTDRGRFH